MKYKKKTKEKKSQALFHLRDQPKFRGATVSLRLGGILT